MSEVELLDFEDQGARLLYPFEEIRDTNPPRRRRGPPPNRLTGFQRTMAARSAALYCGEPRRPSDGAQLAMERRQARAWLVENSRFLKSAQPFDPASLDGSPSLQENLQEYMAFRDCGHGREIRDPMGEQQ